MTLRKTHEQIIKEYGLLPINRIQNHQKIVGELVTQRKLRYAVISHGVIEDNGIILLLRPADGG